MIFKHGFSDINFFLISDISVVVSKMIFLNQKFKLIFGYQNLNILIAEIKIKWLTTFKYLMNTPSTENLIT